MTTAFLITSLIFVIGGGIYSNAFALILGIFLLFLSFLSDHITTKLGRKSK